ncbi:hypothetical protein GE09DRAFT_87609 [Coniochaeta sp. 2T2.1]|nr:hypothetical protein GE09DRAFT_87609 [Coniochaeta sp. 2T2.1]
MAEILRDKPFTSFPATRAAFSNYLETHPNPRRVTRTEREELLRWLANYHAPPSSQKESSRRSSQKESSRRNYVRKNFILDEDGQTIMAVARNGRENRKVITEDNIIEVVELVHTSSGHAGWDATWREVSRSYYGILRADTIFLLKRCGVCALNPRKRPKGSIQTGVNPDPDGLDAYERQDDNELMNLVHYDDNNLIDILDLAIP